MPRRAGRGLRDAVVWFRRNHRFAPDSGIGRLAREINAGDAASALAWLGDQPAAPSPGRAVHWLPDAGEQLASATAARLVEPYTAYLDTVRAHLQGQADVAEVLRSFDHYRLLCALRAGPRGVDAWNLHIGRWARAQLGPQIDTAPRSPWFPGRPVMVLRNDPVLRLFNGDIGIALPAPQGAGIALWFADAETGLRAVAPLRLPEHASAWAMTVHQSQGSEFQAIGVLLPAQASRVLSRELLYTAVTRARERVTLVGSAAVVGSAITTPTVRQSGLASRLREAAAAMAGDVRRPGEGLDAASFHLPGEVGQ
jgi:exodeoxyribonuclease V alpha subunit